MMLGMACVTSCMSEREPVLESGEELKVEVTEAASRSALTTDQNIKTLPFSLFGDVYRTGEYYSGLKVIFNGDNVQYTNNQWNYGPPIYWLMGQVHSFVAIHPASDKIPGLSDLTYSDSRVNFTYTIPVTNNIIDYNAVPDILVATHRRDYNFDTAGAVKFGFRHILSRINIEPALDEFLMYEDEPYNSTHPENKDEYIRFEKFEIYGLKTKASFVFTPASIPSGQLKTDETDQTYEVDDSSVADAVLTFTKPKTVTNNKKNVNVCADDDAFFVLPQTIGQDARIILYYTVNDDHRDDRFVRTITFPFSGLPIDRWEGGKIYTYSFTIEKAYTGQIKPGSLKWKITDITDDKASDNWINDEGIFEHTFNPKSVRQKQ